MYCFNMSLVGVFVLLFVKKFSLVCEIFLFIILLFFLKIILIDIFGLVDGVVD